MTKQTQDVNSRQGIRCKMPFTIAIITLAIQSASAFVSHSQKRTVVSSSSSSSSSFSPLFVVTPPHRTNNKNDQQDIPQQQQQQQKKPQSLIPLDDEEDDGLYDFDASTNGGFYDIETNEDYGDIQYDDYDDEMTMTASAAAAASDKLKNNNNRGQEGSFIDDADIMERDEADMLEEREDRFYIDEYGNRRKVERCILVGVEDLSAMRRKRKEENTGPIETEPVYFTLDDSMTEMRELIKTAGLELVGEITQRLQQVNPKTYVGTGKVKEAQEMLEELDSCTVVFDAELTPGQQKALENAFNKEIIQNDFLAQSGEIKVIDRTALILDIFAQHAKTREGKLQVDLALHEYRKPRLTKMWTHLERQSGAGGVGLRGPGESQLEIDRRLIRDRIIVLKEKIDGVQKQRSIHRRGRRRMGLPILSLVGYTNSGKSTMLNFLTRSGVLAESMLFATLDPTTRKVKLPGLKTHPEVLLTDTVGFIQKLPTHLVAAFRATLEEVEESDVLVHVIDVSNPVWEKQEKAVLSVLEDIGVSDKPIVRVLNKVDMLPAEDAEYLRYEAAMTDLTVVVSALHGEGMHDFVSVVEQAMTGLLVPIEVLIPYSAGDELNSVHEQGNVEIVDYREKGTYVRALVPSAIANRLEKYSLNPKPSGPKPMKKKRRAQEAEEKEEEEIDWVALGRGRHKATKTDD